MTKPIQIKNLTIGAGIPKICVPLTGTTREKICQEAEDAKIFQHIRQSVSKVLLLLQPK